MNDRQEASQRIRIGITGLGLVFLLVLLGTAIVRAPQGIDSVTVENETAEPNEPLAELGAAPGSARPAEESATDNGVADEALVNELAIDSREGQ